MNILSLTRPLAIFDLETTGVSIYTDRIVEIAILKLLPGGGTNEFAHRVNPEIPIPPEATAVHGITDGDVALEPTFRHLAPRIADFLRGCDISGYNVRRFDLPMLKEEFQRAQVVMNFSGVHVIDAQSIFHLKEPRDLSAAYRYYCSKPHEQAHSALADVRVTAEILQAQFDRYDDLPRDIAALESMIHPRNPNWVDEEGKFLWQGDTVVFGFGKLKGKSLQYVLKNDATYFNWIIDGNFPQGVKDIARKALNGEFPVPVKSGVKTHQGHGPAMPESEGGTS